MTADASSKEISLETEHGGQNGNGNSPENVELRKVKFKEDGPENETVSVLFNIIKSHELL